MGNSRLDLPANSRKPHRYMGLAVVIGASRLAVTVKDTTNT
jgi:hypothetical protein